MKVLVQLGCLATLAIILSGCIIASETESPVAVEPATPEAATRAEIEAAGNLQFDTSRTSALNAIAARANLPANAQVHLVHTIFRRLSFENAQIRVLQTLIRNESFSNAAKQSLLNNLGRLAFDSNRAALLKLINERGELKV